MRPFWHPLSTLLVVDPPCFATTSLLRMLLRMEPVELRYAGDRMWPAVRHGETFLARPLSGEALSPGTAVVFVRDGIPELARIESSADDAFRLVTDADPSPPVEVRRQELLASCSIDSALPSRAKATARRRWLDAREAWSSKPDAQDEPGATVRDKYDAQAPSYAANTLAGLAPGIVRRLSRQLPAGSRVLVLGSGAGFECFDLAALGYRVSGVDFAPRMIAHSREEASRRALDIAFQLGDVRDPSLELGRFDGVLFTYDVYSFMPTRAAREQLLRRLALALEPAGAIFLSARVLTSLYERAMLTLQRARRSGTEWGDSHTRWIDVSGRLHRSYVHVFTARALAAEVGAAGLCLDSWEEGHGLVLRRGERARL